LESISSRFRDIALISVLGSRVWPFRVTWRHRSRNKPWNTGRNASAATHSSYVPYDGRAATEQLYTLGVEKEEEEEV